MRDLTSARAHGSIRALLARLRRDDRGAVATIVSILLAGGVVMGLLAISVDIGNLMYERRQVQNGADATALALASTCAADADDCDPADVDVEALLDANAGDDASQYGSPTDAPNGACARGDATVVGDLAVHPCESASTDADIADLGECPAIPQWLKDETAIPYVETYAATETAGGADELFLPFSRVLAGGPAGDAGTSACARAAWGAPDGYSGTLPLTVSSCEWQDQMDAGGYVEEGPVGASPGYGGAGQPAWPDASEEVVLWLNTPSEDTHCDWHGHDTAGGFGWLSETDCEAEVSEDDWVKIDTGVNVPKDCKDPIAGLVNTVIEVPVFDCIVGNEALATGEPPTSPEGVCNPDKKGGGGSKTWYHLDGWAKFYVSGYNLTSGTELGTRLGTECTKGDKCITGWFLTGALSDAPSIKPPSTGGGYYGTYVVKPAG